MLDLKRLRNLRLWRRPPGQIAVAELGMRLDYRFPRKTEVVLEGLEHLPRDRGVFLAMNHTDRYNYWPFQYALYRAKGQRFTATWVKGKYYEHPLLGAFMDATNNIPLPSRGYLLTTSFRAALGRAPSDAEYRALRDLAGGTLDADAAVAAGGPALARLIDRDGPRERFAERFEAHFAQMMAEVVRLTRDALDRFDLHVLVFPQGTRSKRLSAGHTGLVQMAQHLGREILPIGCNGSDRAYPGSSPFSKGGRVVYRLGAPLALDGPELGPYRVSEPFVPFSAEATARHGAAFEAATRVIMERIDGLLDPEYRFGDQDPASRVSAAKRFV